MIISMKAEKLQPGMYVDLSQSWIENPFWKTEFEVTSAEQIRLLLDAGIKVVNIDTSKSSITIDGVKDIDIFRKKNINLVDEIKRYEPNTPPKLKPEPKKVDLNYDNIIIKPENPNSIPALWAPEDFMNPVIIEAINNKQLPPIKRAKAVYMFSIEMMKRLFENPEPAIIKGSKTGISLVTDIILSENAAAKELIRLVSHDSFVYTHSVNVALKSILLAKSMYGNSKKHDMHELATGFFLHDIGKIRISPDILYKEGKLTHEEFEQIKTHPYEGYKILSELKQLSTEIWIIAMQHHERDDGTGYPCSLKSKEIHPYAKICCVTDVFDALTAKRSYKKIKTPMEALIIMKNEMLTHFNIDLFGKFLLLFKQS